jgi:hypothetical protein
MTDSTREVLPDSSAGMLTICGGLVVTSLHIGGLLGQLILLETILMHEISAR